MPVQRTLALSRGMLPEVRSSAEEVTLVRWASSWRLIRDSRTRQRVVDFCIECDLRVCERSCRACISAGALTKASESRTERCAGAKHGLPKVPLKVVLEDGDNGTVRSCLTMEHEMFKRRLYRSIAECCTS